METVDLRLECLKLATALGGDSGDVLANTVLFEGFVRGQESFEALGLFFQMLDYEDVLSMDHGRLQKQLKPLIDRLKSEFHHSNQEKHRNDSLMSWSHEGRLVQA